MAGKFKIKMREFSKIFHLKMKAWHQANFIQNKGSWTQKADVLTKCQKEFVKIDDFI